MRSFKNLLHLGNAYIQNVRYQFPSKKLKIIGVTGTDGKTTTSTMIYQALHHAGFKVALISTIAAKIGDKDYDTGFHVTSPSPAMLQRFLRQMVDAGIEYVVLEVTSHGLHQHRFGGVQFDFAVYTNISHEHLDYHRNYEEYVAAKALLLKQLKPSGRIIMNRDDRSFGFLQPHLVGRPQKVWTYGQDPEAQLQVANYETTKKGGSTFTLQLQNETPTSMSLQLPGEYNAYNAAAAFLVGRLLHVTDEIISEALSSLENLKGRWEVMQTEPFQVVVDFAHTPQALESVLKVARKQVKDDGRIILVFGCAGERDRSKRPLMGEAAGKLADLVVLTAEDPRREKIETINEQIAKGLKKKRRKLDQDYFTINDRKAAIAKAIQLAQPGDMVLITGKGHELSLNLDGKHETPWSDQQAVKDLLEE